MIPIKDENPTESPAYVTYGLIAACVLVFLWQQSLGAVGGERAVYALGFIPATLFTEVRLPPEVALVSPEMTLITSMFLHGGWMHLLGNMLYLWIFGNNIEEATGGPVRFLLFYLLCGLAAALAQGFAAPTSVVPMVGASGAISGVLGAYLLLFPHARVLALVPIVFFLHFAQVPAILVLGLWFVLQLLYASFDSGGQGGGVAWWAHIGGFVAGMVLITVFRDPRFPLFGNPRRRGPPPFPRRWDDDDDFRGGPWGGRRGRGPWG